MTRTSVPKKTKQHKAAPHRLDGSQKIDVDDYDRHLMFDHVARFRRTIGTKA